MKPTFVALRNGARAVVFENDDCVPSFPIVGRHDSGAIELWTARGQYREDGAAHPLDIVSVIRDGATHPFSGITTP